MSSSISLNNVTFISLQEASDISSYSRDYLSKLAREEKVVATKVARQWFIDPVSLQNFLDTTKVEKEIRSKQLHAERKLEQMVATSHEQIIAVSDGLSTRSELRAYVATTAVMLCGLLVGVLLYSAYAGLPSTASEVFIAQVPPQNINSSMTPSTLGETTSAPVEINKETALIGSRPLAANEGVLLLPHTEANDMTVAVADLFSDPVVLSYVSPTEGRVRLSSDSGSKSGMAFVTVPVRVDSRASTSIEKQYE